MDAQIKFDLILEPAASVREDACLQERIVKPVRDTSLPTEDILRQRQSMPTAGPAAPLFIP
jgi:hypothetical protein